MRNFIKNLRFVWKYAKSEKKNVIITIFVSIIDIILKIVLPILSARIIIELTTNHFLQIIIIAFLIMLVNFLSNVTFYLFRICSLKVYGVTISNLEKDLGKNILKLDNKCLDKFGSGLFIQRLTSDTAKMADVFSNLLDIFSEFLKNIGVLVAIFIVNKIVFIYVIIMLLVMYVLEKVRTDKKKAIDKEYRGSHEKVSSFIGELVRGVRDIKMLNCENGFMNELSNRIDSTNDKLLKMRKISSNYGLISWIVEDFARFMLIILLVYLMERHIISAAMALVLYNYIGRVDSLIYLVGHLLEMIKDFNLSSERVQDVLNGKDFKKEKFGKRHLTQVNGDFSFEHVSFGYENKLVLKDLSFQIAANETVAFVGKSGVGKTTIFNLLCKMYDNNGGSIKIDGINIQELDKDSIRGNITIISQNPYIFNMSIRDNFKLVKNNLIDEEMYEACRIACLDDFINSLPNKYDTVIGEGGVNLSGGQKQRLAIARALVQKTEIILFDEATSALDNETQENIQQAILNMKNKYTILIIAHRLSTIIHADRILYLEDGKIIASGSHKELLKECKSYKELYEKEIDEG